MSTERVICFVVFMTNKVTEKELQYLISLPFDVKVKKALRRIEEFIEYYGTDNVYISFSGGLDSTVLKHMVRTVAPEVMGVYLDTWLEDPRIRSFVKETENVTTIKPDMSMKDIVQQYGWCFPSKEVADAIYHARRGKEWAIRKLNGLDADGKPSEFRSRYKKFYPILDWDIEISPYCCLKQKEEPVIKFEKETGMHPFLGTRATESARRKSAYLKTGCTTFDKQTIFDEKEGKLVEVNNNRPCCRPLSFFSHQDILEYVVRYRLVISEPYGTIYSIGDIPGQTQLFGEPSCKNLTCSGEQRTGCIFCPVGCHLDNFAKFKSQRKANPKLYDYCMEELGEKRLLELVEKQYGGKL